MLLHFLPLSVIVSKKLTSDVLLCLFDPVEALTPLVSPACINVKD